MRIQRDRNGFTIPEVTIAIMVFFLVVTMALSFLVQAVRGATRTVTRVVTIRSTVAIRTSLGRDISRAGHQGIVVPGPDRVEIDVMRPAGMVHVSYWRTPAGEVYRREGNLPAQPVGRGFSGSFKAVLGTDGEVNVALAPTDPAGQPATLGGEMTESFPRMARSRFAGVYHAVNSPTPWM